MSGGGGMRKMHLIGNTTLTFRFSFIFQERPNHKDWHLIFQGVLELCSDTSSIASRVRSSIAGAEQLDIHHYLGRVQ